MKKSRVSTASLTSLALMTALICVISPFTIPVGPIPISLATLGLYLTAGLFGGKRALIVCGMYLLMGFIGLPVFSGFTGGPAKLLGPTGGFLFGYLLLTGITGFFLDKYPGKKGYCVFGMILGTVACYVLGMIWLAYQMDLSWKQSFLVGVAPFVVGDAAKILLVNFLVPMLKKRIGNFILEKDKIK